MFDKDRDHQIAKDELIEMMKYIFEESGMTMTQKSLAYYCNLFDYDKSEMISKEEFLMMLYKYNKPIDRE